VEWSLDLEGDGFDPSVLAAGYPGSLAFRATTAGHLEEAGPVGRVELASLEGTLREQPVAAHGTVELAGGVVRLDPFEVTWAEDRLEASGSLGERYDLILHLEAPNLAVALADVAGTVEADATVTGPSGAPRIELTARGESLAWGERRMAGLDLAADIDLAADGPMDVELAADGLDLGTIRADRLAVDGEGTRGEHTLTADLYPREDGPAAVRLALAGGLDPGEELVWRGRITRLDADADAAGGLRTAPGGSAPSTAGGRSPSAAGGAGGSSAGGLQELGTWRLDGPADLVASARTVTLGGFCWVGRGSVCGEGSWQAEGGWSADATLAGVPLALGRSFLPPDVEIGGDLEGTLAARADAAGRLTGNLELLPGPGVLVFPAASGRERRQRFEQGTVTAAAGAEGVTADLGLVLVDVGRIDGHLELPDELATGSPSASRRVRGRLTATLSDVSFVQALVDGVTGVGGRLDADLTLSGTRGAPEVRGEAVLADARADVPAIGLELRDLRLAARGVGREPVALDGSVRSGEGALTLTGSVPLAPSAETPARLTARGRDFEVVDTEEVHALASPDLTLVHDGALAEVTGEVRVPEARVEIAKRSEEGAVSVSDDVVFVGPDAAGEPRPGSAEVAGRVRVILGDDVEVDVLGLHAEPTGSLLIVEAPDRPTTATGELEVSEGTFQAYGQDLTIERGRLVFAGPVTDPGIDLRAFRRASDGVVAGLDATGTLRAPEVTLWSEPPMAQSEQLSYLLLGRPLDQASASDGDVLANAATSLGIKGGNLLGKRLAARYGLEEARIEGGSRDEASLVLGKYLSPRLLVGYGIGLFEAVNTFRIRYLLTDALALEAMTGEGTSADLLYTLERGEGAERDPPPGRPR
jgi:translocation and assembly module TamB